MGNEEGEVDVSGPFPGDAGIVYPAGFLARIESYTFPEGCFSPMVLLALAVGIQLPGTFIAPEHQPPFVDI